MSTAPLDLDEVQAWLDTIAEHPDIRSATVDPGELLTPGVFAQVLSIEPDSLAGDTYRIRLELLLVVTDTDRPRAQRALVALMNATRTQLDHPSGVFTARTYYPLEGGPLPALSYPYTLRITPDPTTQENP